MFVCPRGAAWLLLNRFSWNWVSGIFIKISHWFWFWFKFDNNRHFTWRPTYI